MASVLTATHYSIPHTVKCCATGANFRLVADSSKCLHPPALQPESPPPAPSPLRGSRHSFAALCNRQLTTNQLLYVAIALLLRLPLRMAVAQWRPESIRTAGMCGSRSAVTGARARLQDGRQRCTAIDNSLQRATLVLNENYCHHAHKASRRNRISLAQEAARGAYRRTWQRSNADKPHHEQNGLRRANQRSRTRRG